MERLLYSKREAAELLAISIRTVENLIARGQLASRRVGRRRMIPSAALIQFSKRDTPIISGEVVANQPEAK